MAMACTPRRAMEVAVMRTFSSSSGTSTSPSGPTRSITSKVCERGTGGSAASKNRSNRSFSTLASRPRLSSDPKPRVVTKARSTPRLSRITLVANVVPCTNRPTMAASTRSCASTLATPASSASVGSPDVVSSLAIATCPSGPASTTSVKVPPMSAARTYGWGGAASAAIAGSADGDGIAWRADPTGDLQGHGNEEEAPAAILAAAFCEGLEVEHLPEGEPQQRHQAAVERTDPCVAGHDLNGGVVGAHGGDVMIPEEASCVLIAPQSAISTHVGHSLAAHRIK